MDAVLKSEIEASIKEYQVKQQIEAKLRAAVEVYKKYAKVDKRFIDYLETLGLRAWRFKGDFDRLNVEFKEYAEDGSRAVIELSVYNRSLTWELILSQLDRHAYAKQEENYKQKLAQYDDDLAEIKRLLEYVKEVERKVINFSLFYVKRDIDKALTNSR